MGSFRQLVVHLDTACASDWCSRFSANKFNVLKIIVGSDRATCAQLVVLLLHNVPDSLGFSLQRGFLALAGDFQSMAASVGVGSFVGEFSLIVPFHGRSARPVLVSPGSGSSPKLEDIR